MPFIVADRVLETSTTTGTGPLTLAGAVAGHQAFSAAMAVNDTCYYAIEAVDGAGIPSGAWEVGLGTYSGVNTLTRTTVTASSNANAAVNFAAGTKRVYITVPAVQARWPRERLTADRTYFVRTDGNDNNDGLANTAAGAFLTIQRAIDVVAFTLDRGVFTVTIQVADGTYNIATSVIPRAGVGHTTIIVVGNETTPANVVVSAATTNTINIGAHTTPYSFRGMRLNSTTGACIAASANALIYFQNLIFGAAASGNAHLYSADGAQIVATGPYSIAGGITVNSHAITLAGGRINVGNRVVTLLGNLTVSTGFVHALRQSYITYEGTTFSLGAFSVTGPRYRADILGAIFTNSGGNPSFFPGDASGTVANGAIYT